MRCSVCKDQEGYMEDTLVGPQWTECTYCPPDRPKTRYQEAPNGGMIHIRHPDRTDRVTCGRDNTNWSEVTTSDKRVLFRYSLCTDCFREYEDTIFA